MNIRISYLFLIVLLVIATGCSKELKLARSFVKADKIRPALIMKPSFIFKYNLKEFEIPGIDSLNPVLKDSLLLANSMFLKAISDSALVSNFYSGFSGRLDQYGYKVLPEGTLDSLMAEGNPAVIIHLAQFSLEEYVHPFSSEEQVYDEIIVIDGIDLNAINFNTWLELSSLNGEEFTPVLFASDYLLDELNGTLKQNLFTGKFSFDYTIDTITPAKIYGFAYNFGQRTAVYLFDYLMNNYILDHLPANYPYEPRYHHFDHSRRLIYPIGPEDRIIELK